MRMKEKIKETILTSVKNTNFYDRILYFTQCCYCSHIC